MRNFCRGEDIYHSSKVWIKLKWGIFVEERTSHISFQQSLVQICSIWERMIKMWKIYGQAIKRSPNEQFFSYIMVRTSYIKWNDDEVHMLNWKQKSVGRPCQSTDILFWFWFWFDPMGLEPMIYHTQNEHANHYTTDVVQNLGYLPNFDTLASWKW